ncbi:MAG TPA: DUF3413 domain-containing protein [candidate division Zixibacteria bacterium]|nr:DUF3413 domain-containing protein [candidate division Zixibacteria bacterium]HPM38449.1 DUF3413 domain-containing protein [candidate division Zixibacteria bacterium]
MQTVSPTPRRDALRAGSWFFLINAGFAILIATRYMVHFTAIAGLGAYLYIAIVTLSHFVALVFIPWLALYAPVALLVPRRGVLLPWGALIAALTLGLLALDTHVFNLYRFHINRFTLELLFGGAGAEIYEFHPSEYAFVATVLVLGILFELFLFRWVWRGQWWRLLRVARWAVPAVLLMMLAGHAVHAWAAANGSRSITRASRFYPLYFPATANDFFIKHGWASPEQNQLALAAGADESRKYLRYPLAPLRADCGSGANILLILLDSWNYRALDSLVTPRLWHFAASAEQYRNHYSGSNGTRTGIFSLFYSLPGTYWYEVLAAKIRPVFINHLLACGYRFGVFTSASLVSPPFDQTVFAGVPGIPLRVPGERAHDRDLQITRDWLAFTEDYAASTGAPPFFGFLFYDALHSISHPDDFTGPFQPAWTHAKYSALGEDTDPAPFWNLYCNVAYFEDSLVGLVLADLEAHGLLENTVVIITGDHGQEFNENGKGYWGHNGNYSRAQLGVPLIIRWPDSLRPTDSLSAPAAQPPVARHWTSHFDIVPTLMQRLFRCQNPVGDYSIGRNLADAAGRGWLLVGSEDNFAVLEPDRITSINFDRTFDITDTSLNELPGASLNASLINDILRLSNAYYLK